MNSGRIISNGKIFPSRDLLTFFNCFDFWTVVQSFGADHVVAVISGGPMPPFLSLQTQKQANSTVRNKKMESTKTTPENSRKRQRSRWRNGVLTESNAALHMEAFRMKITRAMKTLEKNKERKSVFVKICNFS